ncbi:uncharacterized protein LOC124817516 isoform X1 [Hydra vulgaris]|uniref:uncharacterized protein LOC124817516 isoform X1 n=2 Tax=Hydra vulgaris TaxID=6087 RepID=UPI001F5F7B57|nr:uncharacterized protein LOC124817516 isoform X1 [Hydra vulgaris]
MFLTINKLVLLGFLKIILSRVWNVANSGRDTFECGLIDTPCLSINYVINMAKPEDEINIRSQFLHEEFHICNSLHDNFITASISVIGVVYRPKILCNFNQFAFRIVGNSSVMEVNFTNLEFASNYQSSYNEQSTCIPGNSGFFHTINANLNIHNCVFRDICTAVLTEYTDQTLHSLVIKYSEIIFVSYFIYSPNVNRANITVISTIITSNSYRNSVSHAISITSFSELIVSIIESAIEHTNKGVAIKVMNGTYNIKIRKNIFSENNGQCIILKFARMVKTNTSYVFLRDNQFIKNRGVFASALHLKADLKQPDEIICWIKGNIFLNNKAERFFGTMYVDGITVYIEHSDFANNAVGDYLGSVQGFGGAIYTEEFSKVIVSYSTFINNTCSGFGGTIFTRGFFSCLNCLFIGPSNVFIRPLLGDILYATAGTELFNTTWVPKVMPGSFRAFIWHPGSPTKEDWSIIVAGYFNARCPEGHNISYYGIERDLLTKTKRLTLTCESCPTNHYSLSSGELNIYQNNGIVYKNISTYVQCHHCKFGGVCNQGSIRPQGNYYGYKTGLLGDEVRFLPCPVGYCCKGTHCEKFDSCNTNRTGTLCGKCKKGTSENLINSNCIDHKDCNDKWFWSLYIALGTAYIITFMYLDKISIFVKEQLVWWDKKIYKHDDLHQYEILKIEKEVTIITETSEENFGSSSDENEKIKTEPSNSLFQKPCNMFQYENRRKEPDIFTDITNISFYFFQMFLLIRMQESEIFDKILSCLRSVFSSLFTLSIQTSSSFSICPIAGLNAITKMIFLQSLACYVLFVMLLLHATSYVLKFFVLNDYQKEQTIRFSVRLKVATIQIILIAYATLTSMSLALLNCVPVSNKYVLFIDGTITCFRWWQFVIFAFVIGWIIPFPIVLVCSIVHLKIGAISYNKFVLGWALPLCYLIWTITMHLFYKDQLIASIKSEHYTQSDDYSKDEEKISINEILYKLESPYKGIMFTNTRHSANNIYEGKNLVYIRQPSFWQGTLIARRLILIIAFTFISSPVFRLYFALLLCTLYLVHHLYFRPYLIKAANIFETLTSVILILFCSFNLFFAYSYVSDLPPEAADENLGTLFRWFEATILIFIPTFIVVILFALVLTRIISLSFKLCRYLYRIFLSLI